MESHALPEPVSWSRKFNATYRKHPCFWSCFGIVLLIGSLLLVLWQIGQSCLDNAKELDQVKFGFRNGNESIARFERETSNHSLRCEPVRQALQNLTVQEQYLTRAQMSCKNSRERWEKPLMWWLPVAPMPLWKIFTDYEPWCKEEDGTALHNVKTSVKDLTTALENCRNEVRYLASYPKMVQCYLTFVNQRCHELYAEWRGKFDFMTDYGPMCAGSVNMLETFQRTSAATLAQLDVTPERYDAKECHAYLMGVPQVMAQAKLVDPEWFATYRVKHLPA
jgi:hypothetical protein